MGAGIDPDRINQFILRKQHLGDEAKTDDVVEVAGDACGLHATSPTTPYLSLFARTREFSRGRLDEALYAKRSLAKIRGMRTTIFIVPREMIPVVYSATRRMAELASGRFSEYLGVTRTEYERASNLILETLRGGGMTASEIKNALNAQFGISSILNLMCDQGLLVRGPPKAGWKSNIHTYHPFREYLPGVALDSVDETAARELLVKRYVSHYGPVTETDVAWWTGFTKGETRRLLDGFQDQISYVDISGARGGHFVLSSDEKPLGSLKAPKKATVNLLPCLDHYLMGYRDRERYVSRERYEYVFDRGGNAAPTILADGKVVGVWDHEGGKTPLVKILLFERVVDDALRKIRLKAAQMGGFISGGDVRLEECESMAPLTSRTAGGFMSPLKGC